LERLEEPAGNPLGMVFLRKRWLERIFDPLPKER
jgi:hypothetical protein